MSSQVTRPEVFKMWSIKNSKWWANSLADYTNLKIVAYEKID